MKRLIKKYALACVALVALLLTLFCGNVGGMYALNASAATTDAFIVQQYDVDMTVRADRKLEVRELITLTVRTNRGTMFYRSLPTDGARYENFEAKCEGNPDFYFYVADNPDVSGFIDVNCVGGIQSGNVWTYEITYVMEQGANTVENGMMVDVVGYGWTIPLHNVTVNVHFPEAVNSSKVYTDMFGQATGNQVTETWSEDKQHVRLHADCLDMVYNQYGEYVAGGITLEFTLPDGALTSYASTRIFTANMWKIAVGCAITAVISGLILLFFGKKREVITIVNLSAPDEMDPMKMGKWIDGTINNEDVTSMIYYFANKGYLKIDLTDEDDPKLISSGHIPDNAPAYELTLFKGLFDGAELIPVETPTEETAAVMARAVRVSQLEGKYFQAMQTAKQQVPDAPPMYETKAKLTYASGAIFGALLALVLPLILSMRVGGGYKYFLGIFLGLPLLGNGLIGYVTENYRYKWKPGKRIALKVAQVGIAVIFTLLFTWMMAEHIMTEYEKILLCVGVFTSAFLTQPTLIRSEKYLKELENILGFKEFITVTEEDKIKTMLEVNPELYYKVLPYAQVLGVTDEWEDKFKGLVLEPPTWYTSSDMTVFDYFVMRRCIQRSMLMSMARAAESMASSVGGRSIGRSGGGGSFGGFGGGGFGGGGGGIR